MVLIFFVVLGALELLILSYLVAFLGLSSILFKVIPAFFLALSCGLPPQAIEFLFSVKKPYTKVF